MEYPKSGMKNVRGCRDSIGLMDGRRLMTVMRTASLMGLVVASTGLQLRGCVAPRAPVPLLVAKFPTRPHHSHLEQTDEVQVDDDTCEVEPAEPLFVMQMRCELRCWARGREFRRRLFARQTRNLLRRLPDWYVAVVIATHMMVVPITMTGMDLLIPTAQVRVAERELRDIRHATLDTIFSLVEGMHYKPSTLALSPSNNERLADAEQIVDALGDPDTVRSDSAFGALATTLIKTLNDPYSSYTGPESLAAAAAAGAAPSHALSLSPLPPPRSLADGASSATQGPMPELRTIPSSAFVPVSEPKIDVADLGLTLRPWKAIDGDPQVVGVSVRAVSPDSAAEAVGLRAGDRLLRIEGLDCELAALSAEGLHAALRGQLSAADVNAALAATDDVAGAREGGATRRTAASVTAAPVTAASVTAASVTAASVTAASVTAGDDVRLLVRRSNAPGDAPADAGEAEWVTLHRRPASPSPSWIRTASLGGRFGPRVGYLRIRQFTEAGTTELAAALAHLHASGVAGLVIDLRNNPGGQFTEALASASLLLPVDATIAYTIDAANNLNAHTVGLVQQQWRAAAVAADAQQSPVRRSEMETPQQQPAPLLASAAPAGTTADCASNSDDCSEESSATASSAVSSHQQSSEESSATGAAAAASSIEAPSGARTAPTAPRPSSVRPPEPFPRDVPIVVLVDRGTASSAELFAAALHDNGRGVLVGENTFGKGLIQRVFPMPNGGALKLTIGEYLRPNKAKVEPGIGLLPDVHCDAGDACVDVAASLVRGGRSARLQADARHL